MLLRNRFIHQVLCRLCGLCILCTIYNVPLTLRQSSYRACEKQKRACTRGFLFEAEKVSLFGSIESLQVHLLTWKKKRSSSGRGSGSNKVMKK